MFRSYLKNFLDYLIEWFPFIFTVKWQQNKKLTRIFFNIVPLYLFILQSAQYHFQIVLPSGQSRLLMSIFWETPDWTELMRGLWFTRWLIVCSSLFGSLTLLNIEMRGQLGFSRKKKKKVWDFLEWVYRLSVTLCIGLDVQPLTADVVLLLWSCDLVIVVEK